MNDVNALRESVMMYQGISIKYYSMFMVLLPMRCDVHYIFESLLQHFIKFNVYIHINKYTYVLINK